MVSCDEVTKIGKAVGFFDAFGWLWCLLYAIEVWWLMYIGRRFFPGVLLSWFNLEVVPAI
jgi:hypothetical protein